MQQRRQTDDNSLLSSSREAELRRELAVVREDRDRLARHVEQDSEEREAKEWDLRSRCELGDNLFH